MGRTLIAAAIAAASLLAATPAAGQPDAPARTDPDAGHRYGDTWILPRILDALWRAPLSFPDGSTADLAVAGATAATVVALMAPIDPALDVRIQNRVADLRSSSVDPWFPKITAPYSIIGYSVVIGTIGVTALATDSDRWLEYDALLIEALAVTGFYTQLSKWIVGRDAPFEETGGEILGPRLRLPRGTPSGHAASIYAAMSVTAHYWDDWRLHLLMHAAGAWWSFNLVYNDQHYLSDVLWGSALGYFVGRWIVRHHAGNAPSSLDLAPAPVPGGAGLSLRLTW